ncbi:MAG: sulfotransferase, partial [Bacteroidia bacterium]
MENYKRTENHKKNLDLEKIFPELEKLLGSTESSLLVNIKKPKFPIIFIVGCARSGTTLIYQFLASLGTFCYPSNLISRFYYAPYIGARIQQLLIDYDEKEEIFQGKKDIDFNSQLGKTFGALAPHEFWYFWNRFFLFKNKQQLSIATLKKIDTKTFLKELAAIQIVFEKPLLMKAMNMNWHIPFLAGLSEKVHFLFVKRKTEFNAQSLLLSRKKFFGNYKEWYSFKPPNYDKLIKKDFAEQVVEQVKVTNAAIMEGLEKINKTSYTIMEYEKFCESPIRESRLFFN